MPRTVQAGPENTWTLPANDPWTVQYKSNGETTVLNYGPGDLWISHSITPAVGDERCLVIKPFVGYNTQDTPVGKNMTVKAIATQANTVVVMTIGNPGML